jgi:hypothetical protein
MQPNRGRPLCVSFTIDISREPKLKEIVSDMR